MLIPTPKSTTSDAFIVEMESILESVKRQPLTASDLYILVSGPSPVPGLQHSMQALKFGEAAKLVAKAGGWEAQPSKKSATAAPATGPQPAGLISPPPATTANK